MNGIVKSTQNQRYIMKKPEDRLQSLTQVKKSYNLPKRESSC
jgi:hypothetical protein